MWYWYGQAEMTVVAGCILQWFLSTIPVPVRPVIKTVIMLSLDQNANQLTFNVEKLAG